MWRPTWFFECSSCWCFKIWQMHCCGFILAVVWFYFLVLICLWMYFRCLRLSFGFSPGYIASWKRGPCDDRSILCDLLWIFFVLSFLYGLPLGWLWWHFSIVKIPLDPPQLICLKLIWLFFQINIFVNTALSYYLIWGV